MKASMNVHKFVLRFAQTMAVINYLYALKMMIDGNLLAVALLVAFSGLMTALAAYERVLILEKKLEGVI